MNIFSFRNTVVLSMLSLSVGISACKRTEPAKPPAPPTEAPAQANQPAAPPAAVPAPAEPAMAPAPASAAVGSAAPTTGHSKGKASSHSQRAPVLRAVRSATQAGFDRLAFEFDTVGLPAWDVAYVDKPVLDCGSGEPVKVAGEAFLQVRFTGAQANAGKGGVPRRRALAQPNARELVRTCSFEGEVTWVVGLARANAYTPRIMTEPSRLVIDIAH